MEQVKVIAPAKINLSLDITGVDEKGYHLLDMVMQTISVFEKITLTKQDDITMSSNAKFIPTDSKNTAVKAAMKFFEYTGIKGGVHINIKKTVPIKAGMAGGSADAAGVIVGLNHMYNAKLSVEQMCEIGLMCVSVTRTKTTVIISRTLRKCLSALREASPPVSRLRALSVRPAASAA